MDNIVHGMLHDSPAALRIMELWMVCRLCSVIANDTKELIARIDAGI